MQIPAIILEIPTLNPDEALSELADALKAYRGWVLQLRQLRVEARVAYFDQGKREAAQVALSEANARINALRARIEALEEMAFEAAVEKAA